MAGVVLNEKGKTSTAISYSVNQCVNCKHYKDSGLKFNNEIFYSCERIANLMPCKYEQKVTQ